MPLARARRETSARYGWVLGLAWTVLGALAGWVVSASPARAATVDVTVRVDGGQPAGGLRLRLSEARGNVYRYYGGTTDPDGHVSFTDLPPATYRLVFLDWPFRHLVRPDQNPFASLDELILTRPDDHLELEVQGFPGQPVAVSVDPSDGEVRRFSATFRNLETGRIFSAGFDRAGDLERVVAQGRWEVEVGTSGGYLLQAVERDRQPVALSPSRPPLQAVVLLDLEAEPFGTHLVWRFVAEARLTGRVRFEGERATVSIRATLLEPGPAAEEAKSLGWKPPEEVVAGVDSRDQYEMVLPAGLWRVEPVSAWPLAAEPGHLDLRVAAGDELGADFTVEVIQGDLLHVRVADATGRPVGNAVVEVWRLKPEAGVEEEPVATVRAQPWGVAQIPGLPTRLGYRIVAGHPDYRVGEAVLEDFDPRVPKKSHVQVRLGATPRIVAIAEDLEGEAVPEVEVTIERTDPLPELGIRSQEILAAKEQRLLTTDANGRAEARGLYPGSYVVSAVVGGVMSTARRARVVAEGGRLVDEAVYELGEVDDLEIQVRIEPAARFVLSLYCSDGWELPPSVDLQVVPMTERGPDTGHPVLTRNSVHLLGANRDRLEAGPLAGGLFAMAVRPLGFRRWTWLYETYDPERAYSLLVERDEAAGGSALDLGPVAIECGPAVDLRPVVQTGDPLPPLHEIGVTAEIFDRATGAPYRQAPLPLPQDDRIELRKLPLGAVRMRVKLRHPHFLPTETVVWEGQGELERGTWLEVVPQVPAIGGSLRVEGRRPSAGSEEEGKDGDEPELLARVILPPSEKGSRAGEKSEPPDEPEIRELPLVAGRAVFPSLPPGKVTAELCANPACDPPLARWEEVEIVRGEEARVTPGPR